MFFSPHIIIQIFAILFDQHEWLTTQNETHIGAKKKSCRIYYSKKNSLFSEPFSKPLNTEYKKKHNLKSQKNIVIYKISGPIVELNVSVSPFKAYSFVSLHVACLWQKNWSINFDRWRLRFVPSFCHTKKGYLLCFFEN